MVGRKFHNKRSRFAGKPLRLLQHDTGDDDGGNAKEVSGGANPPGTAEECNGNHGNDRQFRTAGNERRRHDRHTTVALIFNGTGGHDTGNTAARSDEDWDEGFTGKAELSEDTVQDECDTSHVTAGFEERKEDKEDHHLGNEAENSTDTADDTVQDKTFQPLGRVQRVEPLFNHDRNTGDPDTVIGRVRDGIVFFVERSIDRFGDIEAGFRHCVSITAVCFVEVAEGAVFNGTLNFVGSGDTGIDGIVNNGFHVVRENGVGCIVIHGIVIGRRSNVEQMPAVSENAVIGPVGRPGTDCCNGNIIDQEHDRNKDWEAEPAVCDNLIDFV